MKGLRGSRLVNFEKGLKLDEFDTSEPEGDYFLRELIGILMFLELLKADEDSGYISWILVLLRVYGILGGR